jgi:hypothetical protein
MYCAVLCCALLCSAVLCCAVLCCVLDHALLETTALTIHHTHHCDRSMTPLDKVFMLPADARLSQSTMRMILASGHSRIPVYQAGDRCVLVAPGAAAAAAC